MVAAALFASAAAAQTDPLPSWNEGAAKVRILTFVQGVTDKASRDYVPPAQRIAVFDNDGTLWCEQPMYFQLVFARDLDEAPKREWTVVSMKNDWKTVFPPGKE